MEEEIQEKKVRDGVMVVVYRDRPEHEREFLYVEQLRTHNKGWVSGGTDGEPYETAARRELKEETGLDPLELVETDIWHEFTYDGGEGDPGRQKVFVAKVDPAQEVDRPADEIAEIYWTTFENAANEMTFKEHDDILKELRKRDLL